MNKDIDPESVEKVKIKSVKRVLDNYHKNIGYWEINLEKVLDVSEIIGRDSKSKMLYSDDRIRLDWYGLKESGAHKIDTGTIKLIDQSSWKSLADMTVKKGYAKKIIIYKKQFAETIDNYKKMPFYSAIKKTLV
jgi:hypothetical protein